MYVSWTGNSVYQSPYNYIEKFVILHGKSSAGGHNLRRSSSRRSDDPSSPSLFLPPFRSPFACERAPATGMRATNFSLNFVVTNTRCQLSAFGGKKEKTPTEIKPLADESHIRLYSQNPILSSSAPEFQMLDVPRAGYFH